MHKSICAGRRRLLAAASFSAALIMTGCDKKAPAASASLLERVRAKGEMLIGTEGTWAPWCYHDASGALTGFDVELGRLIAKKIGVKAVFKEGKWDGLLAGLDAGRFDLMINGVDRTPEREKAFDFSDPYVFNRTAVIVREDNRSIASLADLRGKTTANTISSTYAQLAEANGAKVLGVDDLQQTFELLMSGRIDATLNAEVAFFDYKRVHPEAKVRIAALAPDVTAVAIPLKKGGDSDAMRTAVNDALKSLRDSGELSELSKRFFGGDITKP